MLYQTTRLVARLESVILSLNQILENIVQQIRKIVAQFHKKSVNKCAIISGQPTEPVFNDRHVFHAYLCSLFIFFRLDPEIRDLVYIYGLRVWNDETSWKFVWEKYANESDPVEKTELQKALTLVRNASQIERYLRLSNKK